MDASRADHAVLAIPASAPASGASLAFHLSPFLNLGFRVLGFRVFFLEFFLSREGIGGWRSCVVGRSLSPVCVVVEVSLSFFFGEGLSFVTKHFVNSFGFNVLCLTRVSLWCSRRFVAIGARVRGT